MAELNATLYERTPPRGLVETVRLPVIICVALLLLVNLAMLVVKPLAQVDPESLPAAHTWVWWATREFQELKSPPGIVLLGSSLVMHPVSRMDADFLNKDIDYVKHHRSLYMEDSLDKRLSLPPTPVFNFALPGGMVSDDYMVARALFKGDRKPAVMVLGLSIRDFIDNGVHCAGATPAFKYLKRYTTIDDLVDISMPQIYQRSDYWLGHGIYLWGKKLDLQVMLAEKTRAVLEPIYSHFCAPCKLAWADPDRNMPSNLRSEVEQGMMIVRHHQPYSWEDNSKEYAKRYRSPNEKMVKVQFWFLNRLCQLANDKGIKVVLVNMPVTTRNHELMPAGSYDRYISQLQQTAKTYGCDYLDLDATGQFKMANYYDTAHMNASGGKLLVDSLVSFFGTHESVLTALQSVSKERAVAGRDAVKSF